MFKCCIFIFLIIWPFHIYANSTVHLLLPSRRKCKKNDTTIIILVIIQQGFFALSSYHLPLLVFFMFALPIRYTLRISPVHGNRGY